MSDGAQAMQSTGRDVSRETYCDAAKSRYQWCSALQVVTVPAHFDEQQRAATLLAAQLAGLPRVQLLQGVRRHCRRPDHLTAHPSIPVLITTGRLQSEKLARHQLGCTALLCETDTQSAPNELATFAARQINGSAAEPAASAMPASRLTRTQMAVGLEIAPTVRRAFSQSRWRRRWRTA